MICLSFYFLTKYCSVSSIRDREVGLAYDGSFGEEKFVQFLVERPEGKITQERPLGMEIKLKLILNDWIGWLGGD
jgi:hypothetical protein